MNYTQTTQDMFDGKKTPSRNMVNRKPYRTAAQKAEARATAVKCDDCAYRSSAPVSYNR